ncbi:magnesium/cobalt transporter CorA [Candidatus Woesearchaeota archaeon]|nr:magnesium/cobalt transporter CorA [Candidatus Woesearchaeota archaeon]
MAFVVEVSGQHLQHASLHKMDFHRVKWLDLEDPSDAEIAKVAEMVGLSKHEVKSYLDRDELARLFETEHFSVAMCKAPLVQERSKFITATTVTFFVSERLLISLHREPVHNITEARKLPEKELLQLLRRGTSELLYYLFERLAHEFFGRLDEVEAQIDKIEDVVFAKPEQRTVRRIFTLKRTLIYFHKALAGNRDVIVALQKPEAGKQIKHKVQRRLTDLYYDMVQLLDVVATYRDILTGTLDIYLSAVSNSMNAVMKKMAAYGSLVLVPTFITGLYGMNFRFMPELDWRLGYLFAWGLIVISLVVLYWYFRKHDWF